MPLPWPSALLPEVIVVTALAGLGGGLLGTLHRRRAARAPRAVPARRAGRVPARRAAGRRARRLRPRDLPAGGHHRARGAAGRPGRRAAQRQRDGHARSAVGGRRRQVAHDHRLAGRRARRRPPRARARGRLPHHRAGAGARHLEGGVPPPHRPRADGRAGLPPRRPGDPGQGGARPRELRAPVRARQGHPPARGQGGRRRPDPAGIRDRARHHAVGHRAQRLGARAPRDGDRGRRLAVRGGERFRRTPAAREPVPAA